MLRLVIRMLRRAGAFGLALLLLLALPFAAVAQAHDGQSGGGDGGGDGGQSTVISPPPPVTPPPGTTGPTTASVTIANFAFNPATISVGVGGSVAWTNTDPDTHTATGSGFDTGNLAPGSSKTITFATPGTFAYHCNIHSGMKGTVVVGGASTTTPPPTPTPPPTTTPPPPAPNPGPGGPATAAVSVANYAFNPASVSVMVGGTITWTNNDPDTHTATGSGFDTGNLAPGSSKTITFATPGTFAYHCNIHSAMKGTVVVAAAGTTPPPNTPAPASAPATTPAAPAPSAGAPSGPVVPAAAAVTIANYAFGPASVSVAVGGRVTWTNADGDAHTATGDGFDTGTLTPHAAKTITFSSIGTFTYHCNFHSTMHGTVVVLAKDAPAPPAGAGGGQGSAPSAEGTLTRAVTGAGGVGGSAGVTIVNYAFAPTTLTIHAGDRVTWVNRDPAPHTASGAGFDTGMINPGSSASATFATEGTFAYHCNVHPIMTATIQVVPASAALDAGSASLASAGGGADPGATASGDPGAGTHGSADPAPAGRLQGATPEELRLLAKELAQQQGILPSLPPMLLAVLCVGLGLVIASRVLPGRSPTKTL